MNWEDKLNSKIKKDKEVREELEKKVLEEKRRLEEQQKQKTKIDFFNLTLVPAFNELLNKFQKGYQTEIKQQSDLKELGLTIKVSHDFGNFNFKIFIKEEKLFYEESGINNNNKSKGNTIITQEFATPDGNFANIKKEQIQDLCVDSFIKFFDE